jgi:hypothetical protein
LIIISLSITTLPLNDASPDAFSVVITADGVVSVPVNVGEANSANVPDVAGSVIATAVEELPTKETLPLVATVPELPNVNVALLVGAVNVILLTVLFVNVSVPDNVARVPLIGKVILVAAVETIVVLNVPERATLPAVDKVVPFANVNVPVLFVMVILLMVVAVAAPRVGVVNVGAVNVLFVRVSVPANVAKVPLVGNVTLVAADETNVVAKAPACAKLPAVDKVDPFAKVNVPLLLDIVILLIVVAVAVPRAGVVNVGAVNVLFVRVSVPPNVAKVPEVGNVTFVIPVDVINVS